MPLFEIQVVIPLTIQADTTEDARRLAKERLISERKDLRITMLDTGEVKQISMF